MHRGNYFRIASDVISDGESLVDMRIETGMAISYNGRKKTRKWYDSVNE